MKLLEFFKKRNAVKNTTNKKEKVENENTIEEIEENKSTVINLSESIINTLSVYDIIYAEIAEGGAMGCVGQAMLYIVRDEKLICYKTSLFTDENTYIQVQKLLLKHSGFNSFPLFGNVDKQADNCKSYFNYYYGGVGNHVFVNKNVSLEINDEYFVFKNNDKEYHIYSSVLGVFDSVAYAMQNQENNEK